MQAGQSVDWVLGIGGLVFGSVLIGVFFRGAKFYFERLFMYHKNRSEFKGIVYSGDCGDDEPSDRIPELKSGHKVDVDANIWPKHRDEAPDSPRIEYDFEHNRKYIYGEKLTVRILLVMIYVVFGVAFSGVILLINFTIVSGINDVQAQAVIYSVAGFTPLLLILSRHVVLSPITPLGLDITDDYRNLIRDTLYSFISSIFIGSILVFIIYLFSGVESYPIEVDTNIINNAAWLIALISISASLISEVLLYHLGINSSLTQKEEKKCVTKEDEWDS